MAKRNSGGPRRSSSHRCRACRGSSAFSAAAFAFALLAAGCASPGEPTARKPPAPEAVTDLSVVQQGNQALLTFSVPESSTAGSALDHPPTVEIYRNFELARASAISRPRAPKHPTLLVTIPSELVPRYLDHGRFRYDEPLAPSDFSDHPKSIVVFSVRTRISDKKRSAPSNLAALRIYPAPDPITDLEGKVTPTAIMLRWTAPQKGLAGPAPPITEYRIYRGEAKESEGTATTAAPVSAGNSTPANAYAAAGLPGLMPTLPQLQSPLIKVGESATPGFADTQAEFGKTYVYSVRSVVAYAGTSVASSDSNFLTIADRNTSPPTAPSDLVAIYVPSADGGAAHVDLSWAVGLEPNVAGYQVYRSERAGALGTRVNKQLLLTPAFRDMNVVSGRRYFYAVTAVNRSGAESVPSSAVSVEVPAAPAQP